MKIDPRKAAEELLRRKEAREAAGKVTDGIRAELFDKQLAFIDDNSRNKAAICSRRAGKTSMWARYCFITAMENPKSLIRLWGITRLRTKQLLWQEFLDVAARHRVKIQSHETELTIRLDNGSEIRFVGADKDSQAQRKRGDKTKLEVVMEAQLFGPFLRSLVEDVIEPCLFDLQGTVCLEGTPGPVPTGYWYWATGDVSQTPRWPSQGMLISTGGATGEKERVGAGWSCHRWTLLDNPHLPHAKDELVRILKKRNWTIDTPTYVREYTGHWVKDDGVLFYKYNEGRNSFDLTEVQPWGPGWQHVLGWDLGSRDDMALGVWAWHPSRREVYEAASWKKSGALAEEVMDQIERWEKMGFNFIAKVADTGGGGRMYVEDVMSRYSQAFEAAKKTEKLEHVRLMNDEFLSGRLKVQRGSAYATELSALPKDPDWDPDSGKPPGEDPRFPNHLCFIAGTKIATPNGEKNIEDIRPGDLVLTRAGPRAVTHAASTGGRETISAIGLIGTPEHPIWTENRGWVRLDSVRASDILVYACQNRQLSNGAENFGIDTQNHQEGPTGCILNVLRTASPNGSIGLFGKVLSAPSHQNTTYITRTKTLLTTLWKTWFAYLGQNIFLGMGLSDGNLREKNCSSLLRRRAPPRPSGTSQKKVESGIANTRNKSQKTRSLLTRFAKYVGKLLSRSGLTPPCAERNATPKSVEKAGWTISTGPAWSAVSRSVRISTVASFDALEAVPLGVQTVYALSVAGEHEYFANGVLVSNCDAFLYCFRRVIAHLDYSPSEEDARDPVERYDEERLATPEGDDWWETDDYEWDDS